MLIDLSKNDRAKVLVAFEREVFRDARRFGATWREFQEGLMLARIAAALPSRHIPSNDNLPKSAN
ncbi:hypothetical protein LJR030_000536 [Rhizobium sp. LjRoot30]|uniref:hypothetical protein n=1 Tax=Rhizobium sp. LjRoot30 TaxID=3342320 RepID=UPI003ECF1861